MILGALFIYSLVVSNLIFKKFFYGIFIKDNCLCTIHTSFIPEYLCLRRRFGLKFGEELKLY